ncbi:MAG: ribosome biogenesis GTPase Der [Actinobacteria bacterium]|nr:ribosome biogenesis GTPase Der [Actinomycetota bacterium]
MGGAGRKVISHLPLVAVVGRPNVGKSTLVNRIVARGEAIVESEPGVTRDRNYFVASWRGREFRIVDTGGLDPVAEESLVQAIGRQALAAVEECDLALMLVDATEGMTPLDQEVAQLLRRTGKPVILVANKVDNRRREEEAVEWYELGMGDPWPVSAMHGRNIGDLLDAVVESLPEATALEEAETPETVVAVVGRPNVGKSTLFNRLLAEERSLTSELPGTTRDAVDTLMEIDGKRYRFIDTAGWRRRTRVKEGVEFYSLVRVWRAIDRAQVVLLVLDASQGVTDQDQRIAARIKEDGRACVVVLNKWDVVKGGGRAQEVYADAAEKLRFVGYAPFLRVSALTGQGTGRILPTVDRVKGNWETRIQTSHLNDLLHRLLSQSPPPTRRGKRLQFYYATQARTAPPQFVFFVNRPDLADASYERYLERKLRETFALEGTPIRIVLRSRRLRRERS